MSEEKTSAEHADEIMEDVESTVSDAEALRSPLELEGYDRLRKRVREMPLIERLKVSRRMISAMCREKRPPLMSIPVHHTDEDVFISTTLEDALQAIEDSVNPD